MCWNRICGWGDRRIGTVSAICARTDPIERILKRFKYEGKVGWAPVLGRIILGWLEVKADVSLEYDLITVNPTHRGRMPLRHTEAILAAARREDWLQLWPLDDPDDTVLVKHSETPSATAAGTTWNQKWEAAQALRPALAVVHPDRIAGARVLVVDDVTTTLSQLEVIADILRNAGADHVDGLVIARQGG